MSKLPEYFSPETTAFENQINILRLKILRQPLKRKSHLSFYRACNRLRYYKAKTHKRASVGSGLGLAIVRSILEKHGFEYGVVSKLNSGSEFWFKILTESK